MLTGKLKKRITGKKSKLSKQAKMTSLDKLHDTHFELLRNGSMRRHTGKTTYACHLIAGHLELLPHYSTVYVIVEYLSRLEYMYGILKQVLNEHNLPPHEKLGSLNRLFFPSLNAYVKFVSIEALEKGHPLDYGVQRSQVIVTDLEEMPAGFYKELLTIDMVDVIYSMVKYRRSLYNNKWIIS